jgi:hypothetical protein
MKKNFYIKKSKKENGLIVFSLDKASEFTKMTPLRRLALAILKKYNVGIYRQHEHSLLHVLKIKDENIFSI